MRELEYCEMKLLMLLPTLAILSACGSNVVYDSKALSAKMEACVSIVMLPRVTLIEGSKVTRVECVEGK